MKQFKFPALFLAMAVAVLSAFAANTKSAAHFDATYFYNGDPTSLSEMRNPAKWVLTGTPCAGTSDPCSINWVGTRAAFETHAAAFPSIPQVVSECATKRN